MRNPAGGILAARRQANAEPPFGKGLKDMKVFESKTQLHREIENFIKRGFTPRFGELQDLFPGNERWSRLRSAGTELWLDSGDIESIRRQWTREFSSLTVNNTLLSQEIRSGRYDRIILQSLDLLRRSEDLEHMTPREQLLETAFILNAAHGLRLVEQFDAYVSLEEHTDLAQDLEGSLEFAQRFYNICPQRFRVKIPFTPAGLLAARKLSEQDIPVNLTLCFSARQNYVAARLSRPAFTNVFLGRLNSVVADNKLGPGDYVGEKATLSAQAVVSRLRETGQTSSRLIGASFREARQIRDLAGIDVMTIPPKVAGQFLKADIIPSELRRRTQEKYEPALGPQVRAERIRLDTLWQVGDDLVRCMNALETEKIDEFSPDDLVGFFENHGCGDVLVHWTDREIQTSYKEGKIPRLKNWRDALESRRIGLDSLMTLAGLSQFRTDQEEMDRHIRRIWNQAKMEQ